MAWSQWLKHAAICTGKRCNNTTDLQPVFSSASAANDGPRSQRPLSSLDSLLPVHSSTATNTSPLPTTRRPSPTRHPHKHSFFSLTVLKHLHTSTANFILFFLALFDPFAFTTRLLQFILTPTPSPAHQQSLLVMAISSTYFLPFLTLSARINKKFTEGCTYSCQWTMVFCV